MKSRTLNSEPITTAHRALIWLFSEPRISICAAHHYSCPNWRMGKRHAECNCGAEGIQVAIGSMRKTYRQVQR